MSTSSTKFRVFVHKISFIINVTFPPLFLTLYASCKKLLAEVLVMQAAFQLVVNFKMASFSEPERNLGCAKLGLSGE